MIMAEPPLAADAPSTSVLDILCQLQTLGFCLDLDASVEESSKNPSALFERIISALIKETHQNQEIRPIPALLGDGKALDLLTLYREVLENGGCVAVTNNQLWGSVAEKIGCDSGAGSAVKLVYFKYLDELSMRLGTQETKKGLLKTPQSSDSGDDGDDVVILDSVAGDTKFSLLKRKREPLVGMLNWLLSVAKSPGDSPIGKITAENGEKEPDFAVGTMFSQALMARQAMFHRKKRISEKIHPMTNEGSGVDDENIRCSTELKSLKTHSQMGSCSENTTITTKDGCEKSLMPEGRDQNCDTKRQRSSSSSEDVLASLPVPQKTDWIRLGKSYQAVVPHWSGTTSVYSNDSDDFKFLGTRIWPLEKKGNRLLIERDPICKGRQDSCGCQSPGSIECVRFHVREKRNRLKLELGPAFYSWRFDHMGEEVAASWTEKEQRKFKSVLHLNAPSLGKKLWEQLYLSFPNKGRKNIQSYYFNVFLLRRRSHQNRVTPESIDSDSD